MQEKNKTVDTAMVLRNASIRGWGEAREKTRLVRNFLRHEPYTAKQIKEAKVDSKPLLKFNVMVSKLLSLEGQELINRRKTIFHPRYAASSELVRILGDHWDYIQNREQLNDLLIKIMVDGLAYPTLGWLKRHVKLDKYGKLTFTYSTPDTLNVHPDPTFKQMDLFDCDFVALDEWMTMNRINEMFKPSPFDNNQVKYAYQQVQSRRGDHKEYYEGAQVVDGDKHLVVELEERVVKKIDICDVDGEVMGLTTEEADKYSNSGSKVEFIKQDYADRIKCTTVLPSLDLTLKEEEYKFNTNRYSYFPCSSYDWNFEKRKHPSLLYILVDVQDAISKSKSQQLDFMIQQLVEDYHIPSSETQAIEDIEKSKGKPFKIIRYHNIMNRAQRDSGSKNAGALASIQNDIYMSLDFMSEVSSITPAMEGKAGKSGESGALFESKVERGLTTTNPYYELKAKTNLRVAQDYLELAKDVFFEDDRILETGYDNDSEVKTGLNFEIINLGFSGKTYHDVRKASIEAVLDEGENTELMLERTFQENLAFAQMLGNMGFPPETIDWVNIVMKSNLRDKHKWAQSLAEGKGLMEMYAKEALADQRLQREAPPEAEAPRK